MPGPASEHGGDVAGLPYPKPSRRRKSIGRQSAANVDRIREQIFERDERTCLALSSSCSGPLTIQHAIGRGMGGSAELDRPSLLRTLCLGHNLRIEQSATARAEAEANGWSIPRFRLGILDVDVPVRYPGARWFLLDDDFGRDEVWP
jgi:hypothetical protein